MASPIDHACLIPIAAACSRCFLGAISAAIPLLPLPLQTLESLQLSQCRWLLSVQLDCPMLTQVGRRGQAH